MKVCLYWVKFLFLIPKQRNVSSNCLRDRGEHVFGAYTVTSNVRASVVLEWDTYSGWSVYEPSSLLSVSFFSFSHNSYWSSTLWRIWIIKPMYLPVMKMGYLRKVHFHFLIEMKSWRNITTFSLHTMNTDFIQESWRHTRARWFHITVRCGWNNININLLDIMNVDI